MPVDDPAAEDASAPASTPSASSTSFSRATRPGRHQAASLPPTASRPRTREHDSGDRQGEPAEVRRPRRPRHDPPGRQPRHKQKLGVRASFAPAEATRELTGHGDRRRDRLRPAGRHADLGGQPRDASSGSCSAEAAARARCWARRASSLKRCPTSRSSTASLPSRLRRARIPPELVAGGVIRCGGSHSAPRKPSPSIRGTAAAISRRPTSVRRPYRTIRRLLPEPSCSGQARSR